MVSPKKLEAEFRINWREIRAIAETLGLGRWENPRLFVIDESDVEQLRPVILRIVAERRNRSAGALSA